MEIDMLIGKVKDQKDTLSSLHESSSYASWSLDLQSRKDAFLRQIDNINESDSNLTKDYHRVILEFENSVSDVDRMFASIRNFDNTDRNPTYLMIVEFSGFLRNFGLFEKFSSLTPKQIGKIYQTGKKLQRDMFASYILALHSIESLNNMTALEIDNYISAGVGSSLPNSQILANSRLDSSPAFYLQKCSSTFRDAAESFSIRTFVNPTARDQAMVFAVACLTALTHGEELIMRLMARWVKETGEEPLLKFVEVAAIFKNQEDLALEWLLQLIPNSDKDIVG